MKTAGIILAAGASHRLGRPKQLAKVQGSALLERAIASCLGADLSPTFVVLGANAAQIELLCELSRVKLLYNSAWSSGAAASIRIGISACDHDIEAAVLMTCDMPFVDAEHLRALVSLAATRKTNVGSQADGWRGVPACFLRRSFADLLALTGDVGAKNLLKQAEFIQLENGLDVDTEEDLRDANDRVRQSVSP